MALWRFRNRTRGVELKCSRCGYDLMRIVSPVCPECGASVLESVEVRDKALGLIPASLPPASRTWGWPGHSPVVGVVIAVCLGSRCAYLFALAVSGERLRHFSRSGSSLMSPLTGMIYYGVFAAVWLVVGVLSGLELARRRERGERL